MDLDTALSWLEGMKKTLDISNKQIIHGYNIWILL